MNSKRLTKEWFDDLRLSLSETVIVVTFTMADDHGGGRQSSIRTKAFTRKRTALYERLGLDNFNEACLFIFRNKLLEQTERSL